MKHAHTVIAALAMIAGHPAMAQSAPPELAIIVESVDAESVACGLREDDLTATLRAAMRYNRIVEAGSPYSAPILHLTVATLGNECITSMVVTIRDFQRATPSWEPSEEVLASTIYCSRAGMIGGRSSLATRLNDYVKLLFEGCLSDMQQSRPR